MLCITVNSGSWFTVGEVRVYVTIVRGKIKCAVDAPPEIKVTRQEQRREAA